MLLNRLRNKRALQNSAYILNDDTFLPITYLHFFFAEEFVVV